MENGKLQFDDFLAEVDAEYKNFVAAIHEMLLSDGYRVRVGTKTIGSSVSYSHPKTRRSLLNVLTRKQGLFVRIYADHCDRYTDFINALPTEMEREIAKARLCKRLSNPEAYRSRCVLGYDFFIRGTHYQKCRYRCFQFRVTAESIPVLWDFLERERRERLAGQEGL